VKDARWIAVEEAKPDDEIDVLCVEEETGCYWIAHHDSERGGFVESVALMEVTVSHWMELPE
jgi:hypothetical protein